MVPEQEIELDVLEDMDEESEMPSFDFRMNTATGRIGGTVEDLEEIRQSVEMILSTERYEHSIYPESYGVETADLIGQDAELAVPELEMRITEALLQDDRIEEVTDFEFDLSTSGIVAMSFIVNTTKGTLEEEMEVNI